MTRETWQRKNDNFFFLFLLDFWYQCYYPHTPRDSVPCRVKITAIQYSNLLYTSLLLCKPLYFSIFSNHWPSRPMLSISQNVRRSVCLYVCSFLRYRLNVFLLPLPEVGCPIFLELRNPWGKVMERSGLGYEHFCLKIVENCVTKKSFFSPLYSLFFDLLRFLVFFNGLFAPTSQSRMSNIFRDSESLGNSNGKKWSQI